MANNSVHRDNQYKHIATATTTQVYSGQCFLHTIIVNTTAAGAITVYDNIGSDTTNPIAILKASVAEGTYTFDVSCSTGIKIVTAAASDITVTWGSD